MFTFQSYTSLIEMQGYTFIKRTRAHNKITYGRGYSIILCIFEAKYVLK